MFISKTRFINYMRCDRYAALDEIRREKEKAIVSFTESDELSELMSEENKQKKAIILSDMYDEDNEDLLEKSDPQLEAMMKYYDELEVLSGQIIDKKFSGETIYALDTYQQKRFSFERDGFTFYCFLDGYQEDDDTIRIFEVKATTSKKFLDLHFKLDDEKLPLFVEMPSGIYQLRHALGLETNRQYDQKIATLHERLHKVGRYTYDVAFQRFVLEHALKTSKKVEYYLGVLNADYVFDGQMDKKGQPLYTDDIITFIDITLLTKEMLPQLEEDAQTVIRRLNEMDATPVPLGKHCQRKDSRECLFTPICYGHVPQENSVFTYLHAHHGFKEPSGEKHSLYDLLNEGYLSALDIPREWLNRENNVIQRNVIESQVPYINYEKIRRAIDSLRYPIYHLDFETFPCPLPRFNGEKPYTQSLFQFSIHIEKEPGVCDKDKDNYSFLAETHDDLRLTLVENMLNVIKDDDGSILVYNQSFEKARLKEMALLYPQHAERLERMILRIVDLMDFVKGNEKFYKALGFDGDEAKGIVYYHNDLNGSYSIKKVLPVFTNLKYDDLNIKNGTEALVAYANFPNMDRKTHEDTVRNLIEYCKQDTWAMVEILEKLRDIVRS